MDIKLKEEYDQPDLVLEIEEEDGEFFLIATNSIGTKYDLVRINPNDEEYEIYKSEFENVGLVKYETP